MAPDALRILKERADNFPADRYPIQHATAQFHLGMTLTERGCLEEAGAALATSMALFDADRLPSEHAAAANALGVVLRATGRLEEAAAAFGSAQTGFEQAGKTPERAAALHNLGLVESQRGRTTEGAACFDKAIRIFDECGQRAGAAAATRELGAAYLTQGEMERAITTLGNAVERAEQVEESAGVGSACNLLGLAYLAADRFGDAVAAFERAAATNPRRIRPDAYAVAKANLALACQRGGDPARSHLAAGQARAVPAAPEVARAVALQAAGGVEPPPGALGSVMATAEPSRWTGLLRDEMDRWLDLEDSRRHAEAAAWLDHVARAAGQAPELLSRWFGVLLELPTDATATVLRTSLQALGRRSPADQEAFRSAASRAMATFAAPQLLRLHDTIEQLAAEVGVDGAWR